MSRLIVTVSAFVFSAVLGAGAVQADQSMTPTAAKKMMPPAEQARLKVCRQKATQQHIEMDDRAKFIMDCMKDMAK